MILSITKRYNDIAAKVGRATLSSVFKNDFEYYYTALELVDSNYETIAYLGFPINPSSIQKTQNKRTNIKKSAQGITVITNDSPLPSEITIKGSFGRGFKIMFSPTENLNGVAFGYNKETNKLNLDVPNFDPSIKTGFGVTKMLQNIIDQSNSLNPKTGLPNKLFFYNLALNESYLVTVNPTGLTLTQSEDQNMIWNYQLSMSVLSKLEDLKSSSSKRSLTLLLSADVIQSAVNETVLAVYEFVVSETNKTLRSIENTLDGFSNLTKKSIHNYFVKFDDFFTNYFPNIKKYYSGEEVDVFSFDKLEELKLEAKLIEETFDSSSNGMNDLNYWNLLELFDESKLKLDTVDNFYKWMRVAKLNKFSNSVNFDYIQKQGESMEIISRNYGSVDSENEWMNISINNKVIEEDYTSKGGANLKLEFNNSGTEVKNIIGGLNGLNFLGKDINKDFIFANGDISVVEYYDAINQTIDTIVRTFKGSIPEFPSDGLSPDTVGSNVNSIQYPVIVRNLSNMFQKDDRFESLELITIDRLEDNVFMSFKIKTKLNDSTNVRVRV